MKKIVCVMLLAVFLLGVVKVSAKEENTMDWSKPLKVSDFKIEKKQAISDDERKLADEISKGKMGKSGGGKPTPPSVVVPSATGVLGASLPEGAQKHAIVIGLSNYAGTANDLCVTPTTNLVDSLCADGDSLHMQEALKDRYGYTDVQIFRDSEATYSNIYSVVKNIQNAGPNDEIVFFFSGHSTAINKDIFKDGIRSHLGLALYNAQNGQDIIWDDQLKNWFSGLTTQRVVFVFDTCHAGKLEPFLKSAGREVVMSSTADQYSYTYTLGGVNNLPGEGLFSRFFVNEGMLMGNADGYNSLLTTDPLKKDGKVAVEEAFIYASQMVPTIRSLQTPVLNDQFANDLLLGY